MTTHSKSSKNQHHHSVFVLLSFVFVFLFISVAILYGLGKVQGVNYLEVKNSSAIGVEMVVVQLVIQSLFLFILPAGLTIFLFPALRPKGFASFINVNKKTVSLVVLLFVISIPLVGFLSWLNVQIPLSEGLDAMETGTNDLIRKLISETSMPILVLLMGLLPAFGEELFFRGALQKGISNWLKNPHFAILITGFIFSAIHMQFAGFLPRMFLGVVLGYAYYFSSSLLVPIILHFFFNASQAVAMKMAPEMIEEFGKAEAIEMPSLWLVVLATGLFIYVFYLLNQFKIQDDFDRLSESDILDDDF